MNGSPTAFVMTTFHERKLSLSVEISLRLARRSDLPKLEWYGQYSHFRAVYRRTFQEMQQGNRLMIIADCQDFPIGQVFVQLRSQERHIAQEGLRAYLYSLRVMEMFRGLGIGSRLIHEAEAIVTSMNYTWVTIAAAKTNSKARKLYERMGYRVFADDPGEWSYTDHRNIVQYVHDPCWLLEKNLRLR
jgi:ribosomal protein S18 acetylase RimI-like enzyme